MRIDGRQFINFNEFHIPFSERDLFNLTLRNEPWARHSFGAAGAGMQEGVSVDAENIIEHSHSVADENDGTYEFSTMIMADDQPLSGYEINEIIEEAKKLNKSFAYVAQQRLKGRAKVQTLITPSESIPDIQVRNKTR